MRESLKVAIHSFLRGIGLILGVCFGIAVGSIFLGVVISGLFGSGALEQLQINSDYIPEIMANAKGERKQLENTAPVILRVDIVGMIGGEFLDFDRVLGQLIESREGILKEGRVKGLVLYINTPGGTVTDSDAIYRAVKEYKERYHTPVYAYVDGLCASGGFYIACAADKIYASENSLVGSVGVLTTPFFNFYRLIDKIGVGALTLHAGKGKDDMDPWRSWRGDEQNTLQGIIDKHYDRFVAIVADARKRINHEKLVGEYGAKVFMAEESAEYGFIDNPKASFADVLKDLERDLHLEEGSCQIVQMQRKNWVKELFTERMNALQGSLTHQIDLGDGLTPKLRGRLLYLYRPEGLCL